MRVSKKYQIFINIAFVDADDLKTKTAPDLTTVMGLDPSRMNDLRYRLHARHQCQQQTTSDHTAELPSGIGAHRMHQDEVLKVLILRHLSR